MPSDPPPSRPTGEAPRPSRVQRVLTVLRRTLRLRRLYWLRAQLTFVPTEAQRLFALTLLIGLACGLAAVAFHVAIGAAESHLIARAMASPSPHWMWATVLVPTLGGAAAGVLLSYAAPRARGSGIPQVKVAFARNEPVLLRDSASKFAIATLQIGSGASLGREGPTVQICAGIATALGRAFGVSGKSLRRLLPVGAAAGVAAAFNAPIAAVTFTIEEIVGNLDQAVLSGVIVAAALAAVLERSVLGEHPVFNVPGDLHMDDWRSLLLYAALGVAAGAVSIVFYDLLLGLRVRVRTLRRVPPWAQPALGGAVTGVCAVLAWRLLGQHGITGGGYETLGHALTGALPVVVMLALCAFKILATTFSYSTGGAGGIFAPSLFVGGMLGGAFGSLDMTVFGHPSHAMAAFALVGMGAVFSGTIRAPMTSVLIIIEMTAGYSLILPLMIANMSAYAIARHWRPISVYEALLAQDGINLDDARLMDTLEGQQLGQIVEPGRRVVAFSPATREPELSERRNAAPAQDVYPVSDADGRLVGVVTSEDLALLAQQPELAPLVNAADLMRPALSARLDDDLRRVFELMLAHRVRELPVVDDERRVVGLVDESAIARAFLRRHGSSYFEAKDSG